VLLAELVVRAEGIRADSQHDRPFGLDVAVGVAKAAASVVQPGVSSLG
jgi:hypothetical protein